MSPDASGKELSDVNPPNKLSRREFLKFILSGLPLVLPPSIPPFIDSLSRLSNETNTLVYGKDCPLSEDDLQAIYHESAKGFERKYPASRGKPVFEQRRLLPSNVRYGQIGMTHVVYSDLKDYLGQYEIGPIEWLKEHNEVANSLLAMSGSRMKASLSRVVITDGFTPPVSDFVKDPFLDGGYFLNSDYLDSLRGGKLSKLYFLENAGKKGMQFRNCSKPDDIYPGFLIESMIARLNKKIPVDFGLIHELYYHLLFNLSDIYRFAYNNGFGPISKSGKPIFLSAENLGRGMDMPQKLDPFILCLLEKRILTKMRGYFTDKRGLGVARNQFFDQPNGENDIPSEMQINWKNGDPFEVLGFEMGVDIFEQPQIKEPITNFGNQIVENHVLMPQERFVNGERTYVYPMGFLIKDATDALYFPRSLTSLPVISGNSKPTYNIELFATPNPSRLYRQEYIIISQNDSVAFIESMEQRGRRLYAKLEVGDTSDSLCLWFVV